ncbi:MAG TPA: multiprotein-bridging factor 1 family protein [archaeon]|nr:multiprotein-bridging factor 1 family protein [archaeon]
MQCEICGENSRELKKVFIDGTEMLACMECARFGIEKKSPVFEGRRERIVLGSEEEFDLGLGILKGFGKKIMAARQKKGLTIEELGKKIFESASLLKRIESEHIKPSEKLAAKIEKELQVKLKEQ